MKNDSILISNVYLVGVAGADNDVLVNLLIVDNKLKVVTRDVIRASEARITVDAKKGYLMGNLIVSVSPSFLILDQNPRENYEIYLNTEPHLLFAIQKGIIVRNNLTLNILPGEVRQQKGGWGTYTPPPMAIPLNYFDNTKWNKFDTKYISGHGQQQGCRYIALPVSGYWIWSGASGDGYEKVQGQLND